MVDFGELGQIANNTKNELFFRGEVFFYLTLPLMGEPVMFFYPTQKDQRLIQYNRHFSND